MNARPTDDHLVMRDILVSFNGFHAIEGFNFAVGKGELRCLIGPNGAGKTTALDLICGKIKVTAGNILFKGKSLNKLEEHQIAQAGIGRKFQVPSVFKELTVRENLEVAYCKSTSVLANAVRFGHRSEDDSFEKLAELVGLQDAMDRSAGELSHGQQQWLEIAMALTQRPKLLLLDEPTGGMSPEERRATGELLAPIKQHCAMVIVERKAVSGSS